MAGNFFAELEQGFEANAGQTALLLADRDDWTYRDFLNHINRAAVELQTFGVNPGDRVFVQVQKSAENLALYLACLKLGLVYVPLNTAYTEAELDYFVSDAEPVLYVGDQARADVACAKLRTGNAQQLLDFGSSDQGIESSSPLRPSPEKAEIWQRSCTPRAPRAGRRVRCSVTAICPLTHVR